MKLAAGDGPRYVIESLQEETCGVYQCVVVNSAGVTRSQQCDVSIAVEATVPTITEQPAIRSGPLAFLKPVDMSLRGQFPCLYARSALADLYVFHGMTLHAASGFPDPRFQWLRDGGAIEGATDTRLVIRELTPAANGSYSCRVYNREGHVLSSAVVIRCPQSEPLVLREPSDTAVLPGHPLEIAFDGMLRLLLRGCCAHRCN